MMNALLDQAEVSGQGRGEVLKQPDRFVVLPDR